MRTVVVGCALLAAGAVALAIGVVPPASALLLWQRVWPVLLFVAAITVVTELAAAAGLFDALAARAAVLGRGRAWLLWLLVVALAVLSTVFLSLDTTAVLLTPVVVLLARHARLDPLPFALTTVWLANTASLLLPVSNLTNLLALRAMGMPHAVAFAALTWASALACILVPVALIAFVCRRSLGAHYEPGPPEPAADRSLFVVAAIVVGALLPALVSGLPVWIPAVAAAAILAVAFALRRPQAVRFRLVPWPLLLLACGLFLVTDAAHALGLGQALAAVVGTGDAPLDLLRVSAAGALGANLVDNLPAYLALEPTAGSPLRLVALLIGVNAGALITPWASLATLLWHQRLVALGVGISWRRYMLLGAIAAPLTVVAGTAALLLTAS
ncbi:SLC13 family permease [Microbacterium sp. STN6]|uniref:SLC13 family permease n=1 Tax=Microbacterium sp. STN6 TaxID=2995588 RepID=UPI00226099E0|nr:SLC13 family permease [Microbacterium sp. STN6]MCX7522035.1 SLC13 family permease [Microbacterium sp. STN6]